MARRRPAARAGDRRQCRMPGRQCGDRPPVPHAGTHMSLVSAAGSVSAWSMVDCCCPAPTNPPSTMRNAIPARHRKHHRAIEGRKRTSLIGMRCRCQRCISPQTPSHPDRGPPPAEAGLAPQGRLLTPRVATRRTHRGRHARGPGLADGRPRSRGTSGSGLRPRNMSQRRAEISQTRFSGN